MRAERAEAIAEIQKSGRVVGASVPERGIVMETVALMGPGLASAACAVRLPCRGRRTTGTRGCRRRHDQRQLEHLDGAGAPRRARCPARAALADQAPAGGPPRAAARREPITPPRHRRWRTSNRCSIRSSPTSSTSVFALPRCPLAFMRAVGECRIYRVLTWGRPRVLRGDEEASSEYRKRDITVGTTDSTSHVIEVKLLYSRLHREAAGKSRQALMSFAGR